MNRETEPTAAKKQGFRSWFKKWTGRKKIIAVLGILLLLMIIFIGTRNGEKAIPVMSDKVVRQEIEKVVIANGQLDAASKQEFFAPCDSILMEISVKVGDQVKKGQNLGRLDTLELKRQLEEAKADLTAKKAALAKGRAVNEENNLKYRKAQYLAAKEHFARIKTLYDQGAVTAEDLAEAEIRLAGAEKDYLDTSALVEGQAQESEISALEAQVNLAEQNVVQAEEKLRLANFVAESDGVVLFVGGEKGSRVTEGTRLIVIGNTNELEVTAHVNELDAGNIKKGQAVVVKCPVLPEKEFQGEISRVSHAAITTTKQGNEGISLPVTVRITGDSTGLKLGFTVDVMITTMKEKDLLTVPVEGIISEEGAKFVYVVENGMVQKREIKTNLGNELYDIVLSGLKEGEEIILNPPPELQPGQKVIVTSDSLGK